jgi:hypothetical protein
MHFKQSYSGLAAARGLTCSAGLSQSAQRRAPLGGGKAEHGQHLVWHYDSSMRGPVITGSRGVANRRAWSD